MSALSVFGAFSANISYADSNVVPEGIVPRNNTVLCVSAAFIDTSRESQGVSVSILFLNFVIIPSCSERS